MAEQNVGKVTQIISAVLDIKFSQGKLPKINEAIRIKTQDGTTLTAEVAQHLGDDTVRCIATHYLCNSCPIIPSSVNFPLNKVKY